MTATRCTCIRELGASGPLTLRLVVVDPTCPALPLHHRSGETV